MATIPRKSLRDFAGLGVPGVMDDADVGADALGRQCHVLAVVRARKRHIARRRLARSNRGRILRVRPRQQVAFQPQTVVPSMVLTLPDQVWRSVEAVAARDHPRRGRQPSARSIEQVLLHGKADGALSLLDTPGQRQGALAPPHAQHQDLVAPAQTSGFASDTLLWSRISGTGAPVSAKRARISLANGCITASHDTKSLAKKRDIH